MTHTSANQEDNTKSDFTGIKRVGLAATLFLTACGLLPVLQVNRDQTEMHNAVSRAVNSIDFGNTLMATDFIGQEYEFDQRARTFEQTYTYNTRNEAYEFVASARQAIQDYWVKQGISEDDASALYDELRMGDYFRIDTSLSPEATSQFGKTDVTITFTGHSQNSLIENALEAFINYDAFGPSPDSKRTIRRLNL